MTKFNVYPVLTDRCAPASIEQARTAIYENANSNITSAKEMLDGKLFQTTTSAEDSLVKTEALYDAVLGPLEEEKICLSTTNKDGTRDEEVLGLVKQLEERQVVMKTAEKDLERLWKAWNQVQQEIIAVGTDILGPGLFNIQSSMDAALIDEHRKSTTTFHNEQQMMHERSAEAKKLEDGIRTLSSEAVEKMFKSQEVRFLL